ncbi:MAG: metalloprotease [Flavipsychrobacter sp.]|nr:metalloprotease [Flavipsychrobacter sp.]
MRWFGGRESDNVEYGSGGGYGGKLVGGGIGTLVIGIIVYLLGGDPSALLNSHGPDTQEQTYKKTEDQRDSMDHFVRVILAETDEVWTGIFKGLGREYQRPTIHIFQGHSATACGYAASAVGPFYCPEDEKIYLDKSFFDELKNRFHAPGDFANGYVIAHEVGHHVQRLLGTTDKFQQMRSGASKKEANRLSVMLELQADFYAGVWAHYLAQQGNVIDAGDIDAALNAANAIGDDRLQKQVQGTVVPDAFTHGTSQQRIYWFKKGYETGDITQGNTFKEMDNT